MKKRVFFILVTLVFLKTYSQLGFQFYGKNDVKQEVKFKLINNLIVIPLELNGRELSFILDTGVNKTILFNLSQNDSLVLNNVKRIKLQGLGTGGSIDAFISKGNFFKIKNIRSNNCDLYVVLKDEFDLSSKMGITIHGIIGYDLLKDVIVKIDYNRKMISLYNPSKYRYKVCRKCEEFPIEFYKGKPYLNAKVQIDTIKNNVTDVKLLIDSGGSDALWLFEDAMKGIKTPKKYFKDILGEGLSGTIYGKRSRILKLELGNFDIKKPTVSFLDSLSTFHARKFAKRNGSLGGNILKRFKVWLDYPNNKVVFKKSKSLKKGFYYNMSGLSIVYEGKELVKEENPRQIAHSYRQNNNDSNNTVSLITSYSYRFKPTYRIHEVLKGSPADKSGLMKGDLLRKLNGKPSYIYTLDEIIGVFMRKPGKKIKLEVERSGLILKFEFKLKERI